MLVGGWLSDQHWTHPLIITLVALIAGIIPSFVLPWYILSFSFSLVSLLLQVSTLSLLDFPYSLFPSGSFGFVTGCVVGCTNPLLIKLLGLNCLSQAFGIVSALRGVAAMVGPPFAGLLVDDFLEPGLALYLCGALLVASACICTIASYINSVH
jgi:MFS family permease